jgi:phosphogluconate dehydratase
MNEEAIKIAVNNAQLGFEYSLTSILDEKAIVNGIISLLATSGSTNHTIHLIAIAKSAGIIINGEDMSDLSDVVQLLTRMYPNGAADVNHFHAPGGMSIVIKTLLNNELMHEDVRTIFGAGMRLFTQDAKIKNHQLVWENGSYDTLKNSIIRLAQDPFSVNGGIKILTGNCGRSAIKTTVVSNENLVVEAKAIVSDPKGRVPNLPFGHLHSGWIKLLGQLEKGDSLWSFKTPGWTASKGERGATQWAIPRDVVSGYAVVRNGKVKAEFLTEWDW